MNPKTEIHWEFEYHGSLGDFWWIEEDDEHSASYNAKRIGTGKIRSREVKTWVGPWTEKSINEREM